MEYSIIVDNRLCVGCRACEVACKQEHDLNVGPRCIRVYSDDPIEIDGKLQLRYTVSHCVHCIDPQCEDACPVDAIKKRDDGIVLIDRELCTGCRACVEACPLGVMHFDDGKDTAQKCDLCVDRLDRGLQPACVAICPSRCIYFGDISEVAGRVEKNDLLLKYKSTGT